MTVKLLTKQHFEFVSLTGGCRGPSESIHFKMPHCWNSHVTAYIRFNIGKTCIIQAHDVETGFFTANRIVKHNKLYCKFRNFRNVLFSRNFADAKYRENISLEKWRNNYHIMPFTGVCESCSIAKP